MKVTEKFEDQVYARLFALPDLDYVAQLANTDRMRKYAPKLRTWMIDACGMVRHGREGNDDANCKHLDLSRWTNGELVNAANESWALLCYTTTPHDEMFLYNLCRYLCSELFIRLLQTDPIYKDAVVDLEY